MLKRESFTIVFSFVRFFLFYWSVLILCSSQCFVNQKASIEADVMSKIEIDGVWKYVPDEIGAFRQWKDLWKDKLDCIF